MSLTQAEIEKCSCVPAIGRDGIVEHLQSCPCYTAPLACAGCGERIESDDLIALQAGGQCRDCRMSDALSAPARTAIDWQQRALDAERGWHEALLKARPVEAASAGFMAVANRLPTLYTLSDQAQALLALQDVADEELAELDLTRADLEQREEELAQQLLQKVEGYDAVMREIDRLAKARRDEARRMAVRAKSLEDALERLKTRLIEHMVGTRQQRLETARFTFRLQANPKSVVIVDEAAVPAEYKIIEVKIDKAGIRDHIKASGEIPSGVEWISSGQSLRVS